MSDGMQSTAEIAANVVETADSAPIETGTETGPDTVESTPAVETPGVQEPPPSRAELLLRKNGFKHALKPDGREHWLQRSRVAKMLEEAFAQAEQEWTPKYSAVEKERDDYKGRVDGWLPLAEALDGGPDALLQFLTPRDPRYSVWAKPQEPPQQPLSPQMPDFDLDLGNGARTYSPKGIQELLIPWMQRTISEGVLAKVNEQIKPITERERQAREAQQREERETQARRQHISQAESWPGFKEHADEIKKALAEDTEQARTSGKFKYKDLHDVWVDVVVNKLAAEDAKKREAWAKELQQAPVSTSVPRNTGESPKANKPRSIEDIAREVVSKAG